MRKITGKALATVLAMALITSSFSGTFAFAAKTTEKAGGVDFEGSDEVTLVKNSDTSKKYPLMDLIKNMTLDTADKYETDVRVDPDKITVRHAKGDSLVSISKNDADEPMVRVKTDKTGTETLMVYGEATITRDEKDITLKGQKEVTINVIKEGTYFVADVNNPDLTETGKKIPSLEMAANENVGEDNAIEVKVYAARTSDNLESKFEEAPVDKDDEDRPLRIEASDTSKIKVIKTGDAVTKIYNTGTGAGTLKLNIKAANNKSGNSYNFDKTKNVTSTTATVLKKLVLSADLTYDKDGSKESVNSAAIEHWDLDKRKISGYAIDGKDSYGITIEGTASLGDISNVTNLKVNDKAKVGDVEDAKDVTVDGGSVGSITEDSDNMVTSVTVTDGRVSGIDVSGNVDVLGGSVSGDVTGDTVNLNVQDDDINTSITGAVKGKTINVEADSEDATISVGKLVADGAAEIKLNGGKNVKIGTIDGDYEGNVTFDDFQGTIDAMTNVDTISATEDANVKVNGDVDATSLSIDENGVVEFTGAVTLEELSGDGKLIVPVAKLLVTDGVSGNVILRLAGNNVSVGDEAYRTGKDVTDVNGVVGDGYKMEKKTENKQDIYLVKSTSFAGLALDKSEVTIAKGFSNTVTVSNYPASTSLPTGASVVWDYSDADKDIFDITAEGATLTINVKDYDDVYATSNSFDLYATVVDKDGDALEDYDSVKCTVTAIKEVPVSSDLSGIVEVPQGSTKDFTVNSSVEAPVTIGTGNVAVHALKTPFADGKTVYTIKATGEVGTTAGVYATVPGQNATKLFIIKVTAPVVTSDTTVDFDLTAGSRYVFKITAPSAPSFTVGNGAVLKTQAGKIDGNDYYFAVYAQNVAGQSTGVYVNGVKVCTVTVK